jgi:hypothetical protein
MTFSIDLQRTVALGICLDCGRPSSVGAPTVVNQYGRCETCGSASVLRPHSAAMAIDRKRLRLDPRFLRGSRFARVNDEGRG